MTYAPDDKWAADALEILRTIPFEFIHRYHRLAIEEIIKSDKNVEASPSLAKDKAATGG